MQDQPSINSTAVASEDLPDMARQLIDLIGMTNTFKLVDQWGGTTFPVAAGKHALGRLRYDMLAEAVGVQAADKLTAEYGRTRLYIPQCSGALRRARRNAGRRRPAPAPGPDADRRRRRYTGNVAAARCRCNSARTGLVS